MAVSLTPGTSKLALYNLALGHMRERKLASLSENRESKRVLDDIWASAIMFCLERKLWNFARRSIQIDASTTQIPTFGPKYAFVIPPDRIRTHIVSAEPTMKMPLIEYLEETGYWYSDSNPLYVSYTSRDDQFGMNFDNWPASFEEYVGLHLAVVACGRITNATELLQGPDGLLKREVKAYKVVSANCAMNESPKPLPAGTWTRARRGFLSGMAGAGDNPGNTLLG